MQTIKNKELYARLAEIGIKDVILVKANKFFFISSDDELTAAKLAMLPSTAIYVNCFDSLTIDEWIREIKALITAQD